MNDYTFYIFNNFYIFLYFNMGNCLSKKVDIEKNENNTSKQKLLFKKKNISINQQEKNKKSNILNKE